MRITLNTPDPLEDLLAFLRERGCIAYIDVEGRCVQVAAPEDAEELRPLLDEWLETRAGLSYELRD